MDEAILNEDIVNNYREQKYNCLKWSKEEDMFRNNRRCRECILDKYSFPFSTAVRIKLRNSVLGKYLDTFNAKQKQNKTINENKLVITEWDKKKFTPKELLKFEKQNELVIRNCYDIMQYAVESCDKIDLNCIQRKIEKLTIIDFHVTFVDVDLRNFYNVQILVLSGNSLTTIHGRFLPQRLTFLELFDNFISNVKDLAKDAPKSICYLGLARNKLNEKSSLHLLAESGNFDSLKAIDLSDNEFYHLGDTVYMLQKLKSLTSLTLEGSTCWVVPSYKDTVLLYLPNLQYLDNVEILDTDRRQLDHQYFKKDNLEAAQLVFMCHRIMGLPKPPKDKKFKKATQTIHLEVELPLLEEVRLPEPEVPDAELDTKQRKKGSDPSSAKKSNKSEGKSSKSSKKSGKKKSPYESPDEYDPKAETKNISFRTERKSWNKAIQYPPMFIESPEANRVSIRDTFRSVVNVRVVYLKILPAKAQKVKKQKKKGKKAKKDKKGKKKGSSEDDDVKKEKPVEPQDLTLKRVTLGEFSCNMKMVNWSEETVDFYWADHPQIGAEALYMDGCLKKLKYTDKPVKKKPPKKGKGGTETSLIQDPAEIKNVMPKFLTVQVGFGLKRSYPYIV